MAEPVRVSPYVLRHTFTRSFAKWRRFAESLQDWLGHGNISTTQIYTHVLDQRMKAIVRDLHPLTSDDVWPLSLSIPGEIGDGDNGHGDIQAEPRKFRDVAPRPQRRHRHTQG